MNDGTSDHDGFEKQLSKVFILNEQKNTETIRDDLPMVCNGCLKGRKEVDDEC